MYRQDPVDTATGAFGHAEMDAELPGIGLPFEFERSYSSDDPTVGPLGKGWTFTYNASLSVQQNGDVLFRAEDGQQLLYTVQADGSYAAEPGVHSALKAIAGGYELVRQDQARYRFDSSGRLTSLKDHNDQGLTFTYDGSGRLATVTDSAGRVITLGYNPTTGRLTSLALPDGRSVGYGYTGDLLTSIRDLRGFSTTYRYDPSDRLSEIVDPNNRSAVRNTYDASGRVIEQFDPLGNKTTFSWDAPTQISTMTDPAGAVWKDAYLDNVLLEAQEPQGTSRVVFSPELTVDALTDPRGNTTFLTYDPAGTLATRTAPAPLSYQESWTYNAANRPTSYKDGRGNTTTFEYDPANPSLLVKRTRPGGVIDQFTYTPAGQLETHVDARGNTTTYGYDPAGNLISVRNPLGNTTTYGHDPAGRLTSTVDPRGNVVGADPAAYRTTYTYDDADHLLTETDPLGRVTRHEYDAAGNRWKTTDAAGNVTTFTYNAANELIEETLPGGAKQTYAYDSRGLLERVTTPLGFSTTYTYDDAGRMATMVDPRGNVAGADPAAFRWTYGYDPNGNRASVRDPLGKTTSYEYDVLDRLTVVTDPLGHATRYESDANNNQTKLTDANGGITSSVYDPLDRLTSVTDPRGKVTTFGYPNANRTRTTTPLGNATTFVYDADNRMTSTVEPRGNVTGANPDDYRTSFEYDPAGNRVAEIDALGNRTADTFDAVSNRTSRLDANANRTGYGFDELNRLRSVTAPDGATTSYAYDAPGNLVTRTDPKGHVTTYGYDADRRLTSLTSPIGQRWSYEYDPAGNRTKVVDAAGNATPAAGDGTTAYTLDALDRLRGINYSDATPDVSFDYDDASRRTSMTDGAGSETYGYDPLDRPTSVTRAWSSFSYGYDPSGHVTRRTYPDGTSVDFTYDDDGRMDSVVTGGATTAYGYDPDANLTQITLPAANGYAETRSYDRSGRLTGIHTAKGTSVLSDRTYALDRAGNPLSVKDATLAPAPATARVSVSSSGQQGNGASGNPYLSMSGDGRYVVFASSATNLVSGDTNGVDDIFLRDRQTGATTRVSVSSSGAQSNGVSDDPKVSADGRYVAFHSSATNLVSGDTNAQPDIFVRDTVAGTTTRVSTTASGGQATRESHDPAISYDGKAVAFSSAATNLVSEDTNGVNDIFVKTLASGAITRVSVSSSGAQAAKASTGPAISADGRFVAFRSTATNLVTGDTNGFADIFLRDTTTATTTMVSVSSSGALANGDSSGVTISGDGRYVGFRSNATNLVSGDTNAVDDIFLRDTALSSTTRVSASSTGAQGNGTSSEPNLSADGRTMAFQSASSNLITGDTNGAADIFVRDPAGVVTRVSISSTGGQNPNASAGPFISADGRSVAFSTIGVLVPE
ncbi:MAG: DUF6531 domain-containing protein, partial [Nocardioidaceae bacterium]